MRRIKIFMRLKKEEIIYVIKDCMFLWVTLTLYIIWLVLAAYYEWILFVGVLLFIITIAAVVTITFKRWIQSNWSKAGELAKAGVTK